MSNIKHYLKEHIIAILIFSWFLFSVMPLPFILYTDGLRLWIPRLDYAAKQILQGHIPFWNEYQFCGASLLADGTTNILNPFVAFYTFLTPAWASTLEILILFFILVLGTWKYFRAKGFSYTASIIGTLGYSLCGQVIFWSFFHGMNLALALFPWILFFFRKYEKTGILKWNFVAYLLIFVTALCGFIQFAFISALSAVIEGIQTFSFKSIKEAVKNRAITVAFGLLSASIIILPTIEAAINSHRKLVYYFDGLLPKVTSLFMMIFYGNSFGVHFLFHNYFFYIGVILLGLAFFGLRKNFKEFISYPFFVYSLIFPTLLLIIYLNILPTSFQFGVQSDPYRGMFIFIFVLSILAAKGTDNLLEHLNIQGNKFYIPFELLISIFILLVYFLDYCLILYMNNLSMSLYLFMSLFMLIVLLIQFRLKNKSPLLRKTVFSVWIILLICFNSFPMGKIYLAGSAVHKWSNVIEKWKSHGVPVSILSTEGRVLNVGVPYNQFENWATKYKIRTIGGYGTFFPRSIFVRIRDEGLITAPYVADTFFKNNVVTNSKFLAKYGVEYLITDAGYDNNFKFANDGWKLVYPSSKIPIKEHIYKNPEYVGRAYLLNEKDGLIKSAEIVKNENTFIKISAGAKAGETLILSDSWFPGWECYDNGKKVGGYDANGFRGYKITTSGQHNIEWIYQPKSFLYGFLISVLSIITFGFLLVYKPADLFKISKK